MFYNEKLQGQHFDTKDCVTTNNNKRIKQLVKQICRRINNERKI